MFRFTIRDVLWLTVVVALAVGWGMDRNRLLGGIDLWKQRADCLADEFHFRGWTVTWDGSWIDMVDDETGLRTRVHAGNYSER